VWLVTGADSGIGAGVTTAAIKAGLRAGEIAWDASVVPALLSIRCRLSPTLSAIAKVEQRQITLSVNDLQISCRTSYSPSVA
jgi:NADP-dependent 3-hydroxy acid dehydrogenase YdfG